jgi:hypothetical protein
VSTDPVIAAFPAGAISSALAGVEGRRLVRHPVFLSGIVFAIVGIAIFARSVVASPFVTWDDDGWTASVGLMLLAVMTMVATNLAALRDRREHTREQHATMPAGTTLRTGGLLIALAWPGGVAMMLSIAALAVAATGRVVLDPVTIVHLLEGSCLVLMLGAAGVAIAAWIPNAFVTPVLAWALFLASPDGAPASWQSLAPFTGMGTASLASWHLGYLAGLTAVFAIVALARTWRSRSTVVAGLVAIGVVGVSAAVLLTRSCPAEYLCLL